jgi:RNA polymerase sigma factor (sigma-70 family)
MPLAHAPKVATLPDSPRAAGAESDSDLLAQVAAGDLEALGRLYRRWERPLFRYISQFTADRGVAEEILQDTLVAIWRSAATFEGRATVQTWCFGIARRQAHNRLRGRDVPLTGEDELTTIEDAAPGPEDRALERADADELARAMTQLAVIHREVLLLNFVSGLSYEEIALVIGVPEGTVKSRLSNARRALRRLLDAGLDGRKGETR